MHVGRLPVGDAGFNDSVNVFENAAPVLGLLRQLGGQEFQKVARFNRRQNIAVKRVLVGGGFEEFFQKTMIVLPVSNVFHIIGYKFNGCFTEFSESVGVHFVILNLVLLL